MTGTIHGSILAAATAYPGDVAIMYRGDDGYVSVTYRGLARAVELAAGRLAAFGLRKGDAVGILSPSRPQWIVADLAAQALGGIVVPIYPTLPPDQIEYIINDSGMRMLFVGDADLLEAVDRVRGACRNLEKVVLLDDLGIRFGRPDPAHDTETSRAGPELSPHAGWPEMDASDTATIVYTSGTTGEPKGVVLTHGNIVSNTRALIARGDITSDDSIVSYLPLAHMFERTCGHYAFLFAGATVAYAGSRATVVEDVAAIKPTVLITVPRVLEKAYEVARARIDRGPRLLKGLVLRAVVVLNERANRVHRHERVPLWLGVRCRVYDRLVASRFRRIAGGRVRLIVSGGAPLDRHLGKILRVLGLGVVEGYGLTEASPVVSCGRVEDHRLNTVGPPLDGVDVMIADDAEILVRGPNIMQGYLNKPDETAAVLDADGWLHTGDLGEFDDVGNLVVTGRRKEIIVTSYGKNVAPAPVEERMAGSRYIDQAAVFGDGRKALVALIVPDREELECHARDQGITWSSYESLLEDSAVRELLKAEVESANCEAASHERVVAFGLLPTQFSQENGMLTPTLKLRRDAVEREHADLVESLYEELEGRDAT